MSKAASRRAIPKLIVLTLLAVTAMASAFAQGSDALPISCDTIHRIEVRGNQRMSSDAVRFDLRIREGDPWSDQAMRAEFRRFWRRGFFSDLRFLRRCDAEGAVLIIDIRERPALISVTYEKNKVAKQQDIEDYYKERNFSFSIGSPLDRKKVWRATQLIRELVGQKGYLDAVVEPKVTEVSRSTASVHFKIRTGGKTRIRKLEFEGNESFSDRTLRRQLELTKPYRWYTFWSKKALYFPLKYQQDINNVLQYYRDRGYLDADVRPPVVDVRAKNKERAERKARKRAERELKKADRERKRAARKAAKRGEPLPSEAEIVAEASEDGSDELDVKQKKWVYVTVPVTEGEIYTLGEVRFEGNELYTGDELRRAVPIAEGGTLRDGLLELGLNQIRSIYGNRGYVYAAVTRRFEKREGEPVADVIIEIDEDQAYTVRRLEFRGNKETHDVVLRREFNVNEGELMSRSKLDRSMLKLQQLGYWVPTAEPSLEPVPEKAEVDLIVSGEEQSRNEIQVGGGYSELEGGFFLASYQTRNFLGRGEALGVQVSVGGRSSRGSISFTEPWLFGRPWTFAFRIFRNQFDFGRVSDAGGNLQRLQQTSTGGSLTLGRRLGDFTQLQVSYGYQSIEADTLDLTADFATTSTRIATITPSLSYRRLNNFLRPTRGVEILVIPQVAWDAIGGDNSYLRPRIEATVYQPLFGKLFIAANAEASWIRPFGDFNRDAGNVGGVPRFQRFFLGGDTIGPRIFETRTISPIEERARLDSDGDPLPSGGELVFPVFVGGSKMGLIQLELGYPIGRTATIAAFFDVGGTYNNGEDWDLDTARMAAGLEFRVFLPVFQAPIRLIYGWPVREQEFDRTSRFQFSIGLPF